MHEPGSSFERCNSTEVLCVGAGLAGLSLCRSLRRHGGCGVVCIDERIDGGRSGEIRLSPASAEHFSVVEWRALGGGERRVRRSTLRRVLSEGVEVRYGCRLLGLSTTAGGRVVCRVCCAQGVEVVLGPFDVCVGADGLVSTVRRLVAGASALGCRGRFAVIGDARRVLGGELDCGLLRVKYGASYALRDGAELGARLCAGLGPGVFAVESGVYATARRASARLMLLAVPLSLAACIFFATGSLHVL